jgi:hypothetical protein
MGNCASDVLSVARGEIGYSRWADPEQGTKYGRWFAELTGNPYYAQSGVPFCAMGASWNFAQVDAICAGLPGPYCPDIVAAGDAAGMCVYNEDAQPGDIILYDWNGDGVSDHVGIVEANCGSYVQTIEYNTGNGQVLRRTRSWDVVIRVIRPNFDGSPAVPTTDGTQLDVDGWGGPKTVYEWQAQLGTTTDGIISGQDANNRQYLLRLWSCTYEANGQSELARAIQSRVGCDQDGYIGQDTIRHIQRWLTERGHQLEDDGYCGPDTMSAIQSSLNEGAWR